MDKQPPLDLSFHPDLSDEAAYEIFEFLDALTLAFEGHYFAQIRRHRRAINPKRSDLCEAPWEDTDEDQPFSSTASFSTFYRCCRVQLHSQRWSGDRLLSGAM